MKRIAMASVVGLLALSACIIESSGDDDNDGDGGSGATTSTGGTTNTGGTGGTTNTGGSGGVGGTGGTGVGGTGGSVPDCTESEDCDPNNAMVCDPQSLTCEVQQCDGDQIDCPTGEICLDQGDETTSIGACYTQCTPNGSDCASGEDCIDLTGTGTLGACLADGPAGFHEACTLGDTSDGCIAGHMCLDDGDNGECVELCDYWNSNGACTDQNEFCVFYGVCFDPGTFDGAALGAACGAGAEPGDWCGPSGDELQGVCVDTGGNDLECLKLCRAGQTDCSGGATCETNPGEDVGVCL